MKTLRRSLQGVHWRCVLSDLLDDLLDVLLVVLGKPSRALQVVEEADRRVPMQRWSRHGCTPARVLNQVRSGYTSASREL